MATRWRCKIDPGTQHGHVFTLRGQGVPHLRGSGRGDLQVRVRVVTPTKLNEEQRELLERLAYVPRHARGCRCKQGIVAGSHPRRVRH